MEFFTRHKNKFIIAAVLVVAFYVYSAFFKTDSNAPLVVTNTSPTLAQFQAGKDVLSLLVDLKSLSFNEELFQNKAFQSLSDWSTPIPSEPKGRSNPFAPLGADSVGQTQKIQTTQTESAGGTSGSQEFDLGDLNIDTGL